MVESPLCSEFPLVVNHVSKVNDDWTAMYSALYIRGLIIYIYMTEAAFCWKIPNPLM
jgi:hypothetical protein